MARHIILISIDNLRYDCIGYQPDKKELIKHDVLKYLETPTLDRIAEKSRCFTQCISTNTYTTAAHASVFTGLYPPRHGVRAFYETKLSQRVYTLAEILKVFGYETAMLTDTADLFVPLELNRGFDHFFHGDDEGFLRLLESHRGQKLFAFVHFFDVHEPFLVRKNPSPSDGDVRYPEQDPEYIEAVTALYREYNIKMNGGSISDPVEYRALWPRLLDSIGEKTHDRFFPLYVKGVSKFDKGRMAHFYERLESAKLLEDSFLVVSSDHGEGKSSTYNPDVFTHGGALFDSVIRVPLMIRHQDISPGLNDALTSIADIFPTILNYCQAENSRGILPYPLDGTDLLGKRASGPRYVYSETWRRDNRSPRIPRRFISSFLEQRSLRGDDKKFIINGTPEIFSDPDPYENMSDEDFVRNIFRGLLSRFETYDEYARTMDELTGGRTSRDVLMDTVRQSLEYTAKPSYMLYDLKDDPFEEKPLQVDNGDKESARHLDAIISLTRGAVETSMIFEEDQMPKKTREGMLSAAEKRLGRAFPDRHVIAMLIDEYLITKKIVEYDRDRVEELVMRSEEFDSFLLERLIPVQKNHVSGSPESEAERELLQIKGSLAWKLFSKTTQFLDTKLFPLGTLRGKLWLNLLFGKEGKNPGPSIGKVLHEIRREGKRKILAITYEVPRFDTYSGAQRFSNLLRILIELDCFVTVLSNKLSLNASYTESLQRLGIEVLHGPQTLKHFPELGKHFDDVILHTPGTIDYIDLVKRHFTKARIIFDTSDLHYVRLKREGEVTGDHAILKKARDYREMESALVRKSDLVFVVSQKEKEMLLQDMRHAHIEIVPNIHEIHPTSLPFERRRDILFIGSFSHSPNGDAVSFFLKEIFPLVTKEIDLNFYVIGSNPPLEYLKHQGPQIIFTGHVPDVLPYFEKCRLMVAPLRYGAGVKGKLTQSMSLGLPFITTSMGAEGMDLVDGHHCFISDDPQSFADKLIRLYHEKDVWLKFRDHSIEHAAARYSFAAVREKLRGVFSQ